MQTTIRKWGNSAGTIIPSAALTKSGFHLDDTVEVIAVEGQITIKQSTPMYSLKGLLEASPESATALDDSDREWLHDSPVGKELG